MKRIYLAGPMTGIPEFNHPAFHAEAARLRALGYEIINPAELNPDQSLEWHLCMRKDIANLVTCEAIALLPGWQHSTGAHLEMMIAHRVGMEILIASEISQANHNL